MAGRTVLIPEGVLPVEDFAADSVGIVMESMLRAPFSAEVSPRHVDSKRRTGIRAAFCWALIKDFP